MKEIKAIIQPARLYSVLSALRDIPDLPGLTVSEVRGFPRGHPDPKSGAHGMDAVDSFEMVKIECVIPDQQAEAVLEAIQRGAHTGNPGDGKIVISEVDDVIAVRTGARGEEAL